MIETAYRIVAAVPESARGRSWNHNGGGYASVESGIFLQRTPMNISVGESSHAAKQGRCQYGLGL